MTSVPLNPPSSWSEVRNVRKVVSVSCGGLSLDNVDQSCFCQVGVTGIKW